MRLGEVLHKMESPVIRAGHQPGTNDWSSMSKDSFEFPSFVRFEESQTGVPSGFS
jgi:hypothetical protein